MCTQCGAPTKDWSREELQHREVALTTQRELPRAMRAEADRLQQLYQKGYAQAQQLLCDGAAALEDICKPDRDVRAANI